MRRSASEHFERMSAPVIAILIERRLIDGWPLEITIRGRAILRSAQEQNIYFRALAFGDGSGIEMGTAPGRS